MTCASHKCLEIQITIHSPRQNHKSNKLRTSLLCASDAEGREERLALSADQIISLSAASGQSGRALNQRVHSLGGAPETTRPGARAPSAKRVRLAFGLDGSRCAPHRHTQQCCSSAFSSGSRIQISGSYHVTKAPLNTQSQRSTDPDRVESWNSLNKTTFRRSRVC